MSAPYPGGVVGGDFLSAPKLNRMLVHVLTGTEMVSYSPKYDGMPVVCSQSGGAGYVRGFLYIWDNSVGQFIASSGGKHKHDADDPTAGGLLSDIIKANYNKFYPIDFPTLAAGDLAIKTSGGGTVDNETSGDTGAVLLNTSAVNAATAHVRRSGLGFDMTKLAELWAKMYVDANVRLTAKVGIGMEHVNNTDDVQKFGLEACDSAGVAQNWQVVSATGALSSRTISTSSENALQAGPRFYKLVLTPGQSVAFAVNGSPTTTKSGNIPGSGRTSFIGAFSAGIKANEAVQKRMRLYAFRAIGSVSDSVWF